MQNDVSIELLAAAVPEFLAIGEAFGQKPAEQGPTGISPRIQLRPGVGLSCSGVGKVNAAIAAGRILTGWEAGSAGGAGPKPLLVASVGIAGALPTAGGPGAGAGSGVFGCELLDVVIATRSCYGDEGVQMPDRFMDCWEMGFPLGPFPAEGVAGDAAVLGLLPRFRTGAWAARSGPIATVSTCSGTDALARAVATRTGAIAEGMEGAAIGHAVALCASMRPESRGVLPRFAELRVISNTTGDRGSQVWQIKAALQRLGEAASVLVEQCLSLS